VQHKLLTIAGRSLARNWLGIEIMNALSPLRLQDVQADEMYSMPLGGKPPSTKTSVVGRLYDRITASWRREPELAEMGPSQVNELLMMRGRD
jgi:hypothetical protein